MKSIILIVFIIINVYGINWEEKFNYDINKLTEQTIQQLDKENENNKNNNLLKKNEINRIIETRNTPDYSFKKPKTIYVFQRKDFRKVDGNFIIFEGGGWKQVIAVQKQEWEY